MSCPKTGRVVLKRAIEQARLRYPVRLVSARIDQ